MEKSMDEKDASESTSGGSPPVYDPPRSGSVVPDKVLKHANDGDEALMAFSDQDAGGLVIDEATNKRLLRKIDWNLMPVCADSVIAQSCRLVRYEN